MKTTILTTIALSTLIAANVNAATFVMQAHTPSGIQVLEGNKGSEVPVVQQPATPSQPSRAYTTFNDPDLNGLNVGYYHDQICSTVNNNIDSFQISTDIPSDTGYMNLFINNVDSYSFNYSFRFNGKTYYTKRSTSMDEMVNDGFAYYAGTDIDNNGIVFFFADTNNNRTHDLGEQQFYLGERAIITEPADEWGPEVIRVYHSVCIDQ